MGVLSTPDVLMDATLNVSGAINNPVRIILSHASNCCLGKRPICFYPRPIITKWMDFVGLIFIHEICLPPQSDASMEKIRAIYDHPKRMKVHQLW